MKNDLSKFTLNKEWGSFLSYRDRRLKGVQTGIDTLDRAVLGLYGIVTISGAPGCNKSTLALQIALEQAEQGSPVYIIDRENGFDRFRMRLMCAASRVSQTEILTCSKEKLKEYARKVAHLPIYINTTPVTKYEEIQEVLTAIHAKHQKPLMLVVDSLQAMPLIASDERMSIQTWMQHFDQAKLTWNGKLTVVVTSEKKRGADGNEYDRASLGAGKGSNAIEYKSEIVLDLRRDHQSGGLILEVLKNRDGQSNTAVSLELELQDPTKKSSFCYRLKGAKTFFEGMK